MFWTARLSYHLSKQSIHMHSDPHLKHTSSLNAVIAQQNDQRFDSTLQHIQVWIHSLLSNILPTEKLPESRLWEFQTEVLWTSTSSLMNAPTRMNT